MSFKRKLTTYLIRGFLRLLVTTCHIKIHGSRYLKEQKNKGPVLIALWHNRLALIGPAILKAGPLETIYTAFVSNSRDGDLVADYITSYSIGKAIRVKHNLKEYALKTMIDRLKLNQEVLIVTPDGPKGPCYKVKPGIILAAKETGASIIPFSWSSNAFWELKSWDHFRIPKPFSRIDIYFGAPLHFEKETAIDADCKFLEQSLQALASAEQ